MYIYNSAHIHTWSTGHGWYLYLPSSTGQAMFLCALSVMLPYQVCDSVNEEFEPVLAPSASFSEVLLL